MEIGTKFTTTFGQIVSSMLSVEQFLQVNGNNWILADGRKVPGSLYAKLVSESVPDLRGVFLRGKNYGRDPVFGNVNGDLPLGTFQKHEFASHTHDVVEMVYNNNIDGVDSAKTHSGEHHNEGRVTGARGGGETRPNCVTVNYFICIN